MTEKLRGTHLKIALELITFKHKKTKFEMKTIYEKLIAISQVTGTTLPSLIKMIEEDTVIPNELLQKINEANIKLPNLFMPPLPTMPKGGAVKMKTDTSCTASLSMMTKDEYEKSLQEKNND